MVNFGEGELGEIIAGTSRYRLTWEDLLWCARMIEGECGAAQAAGNHGASILWCMASRFAAVSRRRYPTFKGLCQGYSQPINPIWRRDGEKCRVGGSYHGRRECSEGALNTRERLSTKEWHEFSNGIQTMVHNWATAQVENPVPRAVHFAVPRVVSSGIDRHARNGTANQGDSGWEFVWDSTGRSEITRENGGNLLVSTNTSRRWQAQYVKIVSGDRVATDGVYSAQGPAQEGGSSTEQAPLDQTGNTLQIPPNRIQDRNQTITSNRTEPPNSTYPYFTVPVEHSDPQAQSELSEAQEDVLCFVNAKRFNDQIIGIKKCTNIELTQVAPTIMILTESDDGTREPIVNLNEEIFSASSFESVDSTVDDFPDRPIASIESWEVTVQSPNAGGVTSIQVGTLTLKVHNASVVRRDHPKGKYIAYMMQQGFVVRIRYGIEGADLLYDTDIQKVKTGLQWKEEDFFVSQYNVVLNLDKTMQLKVNLMPATHRLLNQLKIGQSLPVSGLGTVSAEEINQIVSNVTTGQSVNEQQVNELRNRLSRFVSVLQTPSRSPGVGYVERRDGTFGLQLHAALSNREIFETDEALTPTPIPNMVEGIQGIQNVLLTRRFQKLLQADCYRRQFRDTFSNVVNIGPLIHNIVKPEVDYAFTIVNRNQIEIGEKFSLDSGGEPQAGNSRNNVVLIFGKFNAHAGTWANKPISSFPINVDAIFSYLRRERSVGEFASTINAFIATIAQNVSEIENFNADTSQGAEEIRYRIQVPAVKYAIYPSPTEPNDWIMYVYDDKVPIVQVRNAINSITTTTEQSGPALREEIKAILRENGIPWIELGEEGNFIKTISATSEADDLLFSHNLLQSSRQSMTLRDMDESVSWPAGISRDFMASTQMNPQSAIRVNEYYPPIKVAISSHVVVTAYLFAPIFIFFPVRMFSGIYRISNLRHDIKMAGAVTNMDLIRDFGVNSRLAS